MKSWAADIEDHIQYWASKLGNLGWWPKYVYHFTDVNNAAKIIRSGSLTVETSATVLSLWQ